MENTMIDSFGNAKTKQNEAMALVDKLQELQTSFAKIS
jgi:hypothetical protein